MSPGIDPARMEHADRVTAVAAILARAAVRCLQKAEVSLAGLGEAERPWSPPGAVKPVAPESTR